MYLCSIWLTFRYISENSSPGEFSKFASGSFTSSSGHLVTVDFVPDIIVAICMKSNSVGTVYMYNRNFNSSTGFGFNDGTGISNNNISDTSKRFYFTTSGSTTTINFGHADGMCGYTESWFAGKF